MGARQHANLAALPLIAQPTAAQHDVDLVAKVGEQASVQGLLARGAPRRLIGGLQTRDLRALQASHKGGNTPRAVASANTPRAAALTAVAELSGRAGSGAGPHLAQRITGISCVLWRARDDGSLAASGVVALNKGGLQRSRCQAQQLSRGLHLSCKGN